jgi:GUN4-like
MNFVEKHKTLLVNGLLAPVVIGVIVGIIQTFLQPAILESSGIVKPEDKKSVVDCSRELDNKGYTELKSLCSPLKNNFLREADDKTYKAIGAIVKGKQWDEKYYSAESIANKNMCSELLSIDKLWKEASSNKLGFTIQKKIWDESKNNYQIFTEKVGWTNTEGEWKVKLSYELNDQTKNGHLPALWNQKPGDPAVGKSSGEKEYERFFKAIEKCQSSAKE